jgi:hypothetical protein
LDVDVEVISSVVTWLSVLVDGVDGEDSWFVIDERDESRSFGVGLVSGGGLLDVGVEWSILDWVTVEGDLNGVVSWGSDGVFDIVGSVSVILDVWVNFLWASNVDLEGVSSLVDWFTLVVNAWILKGRTWSVFPPWSPGPSAQELPALPCSMSGWNGDPWMWSPLRVMATV